jgi:hypothetical protein
MATDKTYASIGNNGTAVVVTEIIPPVVLNGRSIPIEERYHPNFVAGLIDITDIVPQPQVGWLYAGGEFSPPTA